MPDPPSQPRVSRDAAVPPPCAPRAAYAVCPLRPCVLALLSHGFRGFLLPFCCCCCVFLFCFVLFFDIFYFFVYTFCFLMFLKQAHNCSVTLLLRRPGAAADPSTARLQAEQGRPFAPAGTFLVYLRHVNLQCVLALWDCRAYFHHPPLPCRSDREGAQPRECGSRPSGGPP